MKALLVLTVSGAVGVLTARAVRTVQEQRAGADLWREGTDPV
ncbi:hypothetical protein CLV35_0780 [Motilibacter peucedani]|uniref:Uncharacterized protein n=1 Tax=Motilibacter peucedani TaxID=598650 RepID=A0A420XUB8_9ACTN|nr:hypothetical protein [Motilibacter peucedani]RKS80350.1 hypothetical protein CLV35_0780 [Motilibacter peucedani]